MTAATSQAQPLPRQAIWANDLDRLAASGGAMRMFLAQDPA